MAVAGLFMAVDRASAGAFAPLAADATALGFEVEWDRAVPGGDAWWAATLAKVERADAFVYVVTATSIAAKSCQAQLRYAIALGTPVLPVLVADDISDVDLPRSLGQLQRIDYRDPSSSAMARLFAALRGLPPRARGPELVPTPPCPRELSLDIAARLALPEPLSRPEQDAILDQLGYYVSCGYSAAEVRDVLHRLRRRRSDMLPSNRQQLEELDTALVRAADLPRIPRPTGRDQAVDGQPPVGSAFVSYSRAERQVVDRLVDDIALLGLTVLIDQNLPGGKPWWDELLSNIRDADAFVLAAGPASVASRACRAELSYASELGKSVLRVDLQPPADVAAPLRLADAPSVRYQPGDKASIAAIARVLRTLARAELPERLPRPPDAPATSLFDVQNRLRSQSELDEAAQIELLQQIWSYVDDGVAMVHIARLIGDFERRGDSTVQTLDAIAELRARLNISRQDEERKGGEPSRVPESPETVWRAEDPGPPSDQSQRDAEAGRQRDEAEEDANRAEAQRAEERARRAEAERQAEAEAGNAGRAEEQRRRIAEENAPRAETERPRAASHAPQGDAANDDPVRQAAKQRGTVREPHPRSALRRAARVAAAMAVVGLAGVGVLVQLVADDDGTRRSFPLPTTSRTLGPTVTRRPTPGVTASPADLRLPSITGTVEVDWSLAAGDRRSAVVRTTRHAGVADVSYFSSALGRSATLWERLDLKAINGQPAWVGSAPKSHAGVPISSYVPDVFYLARDSDGHWTITKVCSGQRCAPATVRPG